MNRIVTLLFCILFIISGLQGQTNNKMSEEQLREFEQQFISKSKDVSTLQCTFTQTKTSTLVAQNTVSKGVMFYKKPSMLVWEYVKPTKSTLVLNGKNAYLLNDKGKAVGNNRVIRQLGEMIINLVNGNSMMTNSKVFKVEAYESRNNMALFELTPIQKRLKDYYQKITIKIDRKTLIATEIVMLEKSGDSITILLHNMQINKEIADSKFIISQ